MSSETGRVTDADALGARHINNRNVTASESSSEENINKRNAPDGRSLEEVEANMYALLGKKPPDRNDPEEVARRKAARARYEAEKHGDKCSKCFRELSAQESVYITVVSSGTRPLTGTHFRHYGPVCEDCAPARLRKIERGVWYKRFPLGYAEVSVNQPCETCGRHVVFTETDRQHYNRRHVFCCERCQWTYHNRRRNERAAEARTGKVCETCGEQFTATRRDAKYCSDACKQRAYRRRRAKR